jgi:hypothetical protein
LTDFARRSEFSVTKRRGNALVSTADKARVRN